MSGRRLHPAAAAVLVALLSLTVVLALAPDALAAAGNDVGANVGGLLRGYAAQLFGGVIAVVGLVFLINRRYGELLMFVLASVVVGWLVFSPDKIANTARGIAGQVFK